MQWNDPKIGRSTGRISAACATARIHEVAQLSTKARVVLCSACFSGRLGQLACAPGRAKMMSV
eukprot:2910599-Lingulodinium_polyedra.AAC.1